jgi:uncharacterized protein with HEPN domain
LRNRLVHAYFDVDRDILWQTVTVAIADLLRTLDAWHARAADGPGA